jgi:hypothetical protein
VINDFDKFKLLAYRLAFCSNLLFVYVDVDSCAQTCCGSPRRPDRSATRFGRTALDVGPKRRHNIGLGVRLEMINLVISSPIE